MSSGFLRKIMIALGVLLVVWGGARLIRGTGQDRSAPFVPVKLDKAAVDAITIERPTDTVRLAKSGAEWTVNGQRTAKGLAADLVAALADSAAQGEVIAESATSHQQLGVDSAGARRLVATQGGKVLLTYLVGKRGPNYESAYLRLPGQNVVYQVRGRLVEFVEKRPDDWRDKEVLAIDPDSLSAIEIHRGKATYGLTRSGKQWSLGGAPTDSAAVATFLNQLKHLEATGFATAAQADSAHFNPPDRSLKLTGPGTRVVSLAFDSTTGGFWVKRDTAAVIFKLDQYAANQLTPGDSTLRKRK